MAAMREKAKTGGSDAAGTARAFVSLDELLRLKHRARGFSFLPRQPVHSLLTGRHASRLRGRGLNFEELRHYCEGDDTRSIDWLATARLGSPHVRVYSEERDRPVLLLVDQRSSMFFGSRRCMKSVAAAEAAALAAWRVTSLGDRIGAVVFGDARIVDIKPQARDAGAIRVLSEVARQNRLLGAAGGAPGQFNAALRQAARLATHDWLICLISDAAGADDETTRLVTRLCAHNDVLSIYVHDPLEHDLPDVGTAVFASDREQIEVEFLLTRPARPFRERTCAMARASRRILAPPRDSRPADLDRPERRRAIAGTDRQAPRPARGGGAGRRRDMTADPGDLANLRDLAMPAPVSFWPPAVGVWILAAGLCALLAVALWRAVRRYRASAYRRAAVAELGAIAAGAPGAAEKVSAILKRVAMVDYGRPRVASLTGAAWADFITANGGTDAAVIGQALTGAFDARRAPDPSAHQRLVAAATRWVRGRPPPNREA